MSYLGRVGRRAGAAVGQAPVVAPSGRVTSPLARVDQRLNWLGDAEMPAAPTSFTRSPGFGTTEEGPEIAPEVSFREHSVRAASPLVRTSRSSVTAPTPAHRSPSAFERAHAPTSAPVALGTTQPAEPSSTESPVATRAVPAPKIPHRARETRQGTAQSRAESAPPGQQSAAASARLAEPVVRWETARREDPAREKGASSTEHASGQERTRSGEASQASSSSQQATPESLARAMSEAMGKVERWMQTPTTPKSQKAALSERSAPAAQPVVARQVAQNVAPSRAFPPPERRAPAPPRLTIGHIDVQVVTPPPVSVAPAPRVVKQGPRASATSSVSPLSHFSFGLGQR